MKVGILGGTGPAGLALAARLASVGINVIVGSRSVERAVDACDSLHKRWPDRDLPLMPGGNADAAGADLVIVATPWDAAADTAASVGPHLAGKVVVSMANALTKVDGELQALIPPGGSVAVAVQEAVEDAAVAAAFHHLPARSLADLDRPVEGDVLICSDSAEAVSATADLVRAIPDLRPLHAGSLATAAPVEAFTAVLLGINRRYKARAAIRLTGINTDGATPGG
ncbi:MAG: NADPH-dependent F420 reductase [Acidimicrobiales bacterium]